MKKIALEGPINKCTDEQCIDWRKKAIDELGALFTFHNPMDFDCRGKEKELRGALVRFDEVGLASSDILLVNAERPGWGTPMAVQIGYMAHKHIVAFCPDNNPSPWLVDRASVMVKNIDEAIAYLKTIS